ncbi:hypothetical protein [Synechococcus sp. CBW1107]|uniref:hypothetical protein n=1 Tax=Synechococcus sp. CBW1107 TaxID=2789857 RepID=UPI002AD34AC6|nr:hypothetical protein [Synechococcus sp. CBW1107]CAK6689812.1 hypothetical protein MNNICLKF_00695 [Synechococcus sp. CBW1107]
MEADLSIEVAKVILLLLMIAVAGAATYLTSALNVLIRPISRQLIELHKGDTGGLEPRLQYIRQRYIALLSHVDNIDTAGFSAGEIERLSLRILGREVTAASAHSWIHQAPGILISLGLLGTFWGLTVGLSQISGALAPGATSEQTMAALSAIVAPMSTAFQTSLIGLLLSLVVLITSQLSGTRTCLERCESLLSSWLETVLPQELGDKLMTPLKKSIDGLNQTTQELPSAVSASVEKAMKEAFAEKLAKMFNISSTIAVEAQQATRQLSAVASNLNESGQDFVMAARAFQQSKFPEALRESVSGLLETKERITASSESLSARMQEVRDALLVMQTQWQLLAKSAETELETCRLATQQLNAGVEQLQTSSQALGEGVEVTAVAAKQLKETRLEVMRDRKLSIEVAESVRDRLAVDSSSVETCLVFANALETALNKWNDNVRHLDQLREVFIQASITGRNDDTQALQSLKEETEALIRSLQNSISADLGAAISTRAADIQRLGEPITRAQELSNGVVLQLLDLQARLNAATEDSAKQGLWGQGGNT